MEYVYPSLPCFWILNYTNGVIRETGHGTGRAVLQESVKWMLTTLWPPKICMVAKGWALMLACFTWRPKLMYRECPYCLLPARKTSCQRQLPVWTKDQEPTGPASDHVTTDLKGQQRWAGRGLKNVVYYMCCIINYWLVAQAGMLSRKGKFYVVSVFSMTHNFVHISKDNILDLVQLCSWFQAPNVQQ